MLNLEKVKETFIIEARALLEEFEAQLLNLEKTPDDQGAIDSIFRSVHTIKGSGGVFGFQALESFSHRLESYLEEVRAGTLKLTSSMVQSLFFAHDYLVRTLVTGLRGHFVIDLT